MDETLPIPQHPVSSTDRLTLTLFFAVALHAMIILGITFGVYDDTPPPRALPTLDVTIATRSTAPPEEADYLAQTNQDGGGNVEEKVRPQEALPAQAPSVKPQQPTPQPTQVVTRDEAEHRVLQDKEAIPDQERAELSATELIKRSKEMINLNEQMNEMREAYAKRPRQVFITARTREFKYASYLSEWVSKVEKVGNLNYPDNARREGISGGLLLDVALNSDGTVRNITVLRASGHTVIDEAAIRIVNLAAPYAPFPPDIRKDADVMHITRTWEFSTTNRLVSH